MLQLSTSPQVEASYYASELLPSDDESVGPCAPPAQISGPYTVLPPIAQLNGSDTELYSDRSNSQKQLRRLPFTDGKTETAEGTIEL